MTRTTSAHARPPAWRTPLVVALVAILAIAAGTAIALATGRPPETGSGSPTAPPSPTASPGESPTESPEPTASPSEAPGETPDPTQEPSPTPGRELALHRPWQSVRITVNGLAVRSGPGTQFDPVSEYRYDADTNTLVLLSDEVRLNAGHFVWIEDGPIVIDGMPWYSIIDTLPQAEPRDGPSQWDADGDVDTLESFWVAGGSASEPYLVPDEAPEPDGPVHGEGPDPYAIVFGAGDDVTGTFSPTTPVGIRWAAAAPQGGTCSITFRLEPAGIEMHSVQVEGWAVGDEWWPQDGSDPDGDQRVEIETDCSWSLRVVPIVG